MDERRAQSEGERKGEIMITTTLRLDDDIKVAAAEVFRSLGISFNSGVKIYLMAVAREHRIPFSLDLDIKAVKKDTEREG